MEFTYTPLLRWKRGERAALQQLSSTGRTDVRPLFLLGADNFKDKKATAKADAVAAPAAFAAEVMAAWGKAPFVLDASPVPASAAGAHPVADISKSLQSLGVTMIPAISLHAEPAYSKAVSSVVATTGLGICLRIALSEMTSAARWLPSWPYALEETDLIIDIGASVDSVLALGTAVDAAFRDLHSGKSWRSVTLAATSIPENFSGLASGLYTIPRSEATLWRQLCAAGLPYPLNYGDYATVSMGTPAPGIAWGYPITAKYTLPSDFLVCRGVRTKGMGAKDLATQLKGHAKSIKAYAARGPISYCWADKAIDEIASGKQKPSSLEFWVSVGVNRHIELVRSVLP